MVARVNAEGVLAARAIDGVTEEVRYHGEVVGERTRYCSRLLLAHLGRLDRLAERPDAASFAEDWEAELARFERGEDVLATRAAAPPPQSAPGPGKSSPEPCNTRSMSNTPGPAKPRVWDDIDYEMDLQRPLDAPDPELLGDPVAVAACQRDVFEAGEDGWWTVGEGHVFFVPDGRGGWMPDPDDLPPVAADG